MIEKNTTVCRSKINCHICSISVYFCKYIVVGICVVRVVQMVLFIEVFFGMFDLVFAINT